MQARHLGKDLPTKIAVLDLETTGSNIHTDEIIQIGCLVYSQGQVIHRERMLINPLRPIPKEITQLTGIQDQAVKEAASLDQVVDYWYQVLKDCILLAHNLAFDFKFIQEAFSRRTYNYQPLAMDTVKLAKVCLPQAEGYNLTQLAGDLSLDFHEAHDALADAIVTGQIVSQLAEKVLAMPDNLRDQLEILSQAMPHDEWVFFRHPDYFLLQDIGKDKPEGGQKIKEDSIKTQESPISLLAEWALDQANYSIQVVEDPPLTLSWDFLVSLIHRKVQDQDLVILASSQAYLDDLYAALPQDLQQVWAQIHGPWEFVSYQAMEAIYQQGLWKHFNHVELVTYASGWVWLYETQTGLYQELNPEFQLKKILFNHSESRARQVSSYYRDYQRRLPKKAIIAATARDYHRLVVQEGQDFYPGRFCILADLQRWIQTYRNQLSQSWSLSDWLVSLVEEMETDLGSIQKDQETKNARLQDQLNHVFTLIEERLQEGYDFKPEGQEAFRIYLNPQLQADQELWLQLKHLVSDMEVYLKLAYGPTEGKKIAPLSDYFQAGQRQYLAISGDWIYGKVYHVRVHLMDIYLPQKVWQSLTDFSQTLILCRGDFQETLRQANESGEVNQPTHIIRLPYKNFQASLEVRVPLAYLSGDQEAGQAVVDYIQDHLETLGSQLIILVNSKRDIVKLHQYIQKAGDILDHYELISRKRQGSLRKVLRRTLESQSYLLLIKASDLAQLPQWLLDQGPEVFVIRLPFQGFQAESLASQILSLEGRDPFQKVILPDMVQSLKEILALFLNTPTIPAIYLMDERIYTQSYSGQVQSQLSDQINLSIWDDFA